MTDREEADESGESAAFDAAQEGAELIAEGELEQAIAVLQALIDRDPKNEYAHFHLGSAYFEQHDYAKALREFVTALDIAPTYLGAMINTGHTLRLLGRYDQAIRMAHEVLKREAEDPDALFLIGASHFARGDNDSAQKFLERFLATRPEAEVALEVEGMLQVIRGDVVPADSDEPD